MPHSARPDPVPRARPGRPTPQRATATRPGPGSLRGLALLVGLSLAGWWLMRVWRAANQTPASPLPAGRHFDYGDRSGWSQPASAMRGAARDASVPRDLQTPPALRAYGTTVGNPDAGPTRPRAGPGQNGQRSEVMA